MMCLAQGVTKPVVNVDAFSYSNNFSRSEVEIIRNNVISSLQETKRIIVVDMQNQNSVKMEAERRKAEAAMNDEHEVSEIVQLNANNILKGNLNSIHTTQSSGTGILDGRPHTYYNTEIEYTIQLIDPGTGATQQTYTYKCSGSSIDDGGRESRLDAVKNSSKNMKAFIEDAFPVNGTIVAVEEGDENKAKVVYINLGRDQGIEKGQKFIVYAIIDIAGEKTEREIGTLTAVNVVGANRTLCKVNNGGDVIAQNLASNNEMMIKSRIKKGLFGDTGLFGK